MAQPRRPAVEHAAEVLGVTRLVEQRIPADPANPESREAVPAQAGPGWPEGSEAAWAEGIGLGAALAQCLPRARTPINRPRPSR